MIALRVPDTGQWLAAMEAAEGRPVAALGYDAVNSRGKRQQPTGVLRSEEQELLGNARRRLVSTSRDLWRNFAIVGWMVRRHLDYVSTFDFQARTGSRRLDDWVEKKHRDWAEDPCACDVAARLPLPEMFRIGEGLCTIDGDVFFHKLRDGRLQPVEGDCVRQAPGEWAMTDAGHGVRLDKYKRALAYSVCRRVWAGGFRFVREVDARHMVHHSHWMRFDQVRGVSPIASALNSLRDVYENFDYALARAKLSQLFGLVFFRKGMGELGTITKGAAGYADQVDFGKGPVVLDLDPGDEAKFLESTSPSVNFQEFNVAMIAASLKALDIPMSFYDESYTNYSGARQARLEYEAGAKIKRGRHRRMRDAVLRWRFGLWDQDGELPKSVRAEDLRWEHVHAGLPWLDPLNEVQADVLAIDAGIRTRTEVLAEQGKVFSDVARTLGYERRVLDFYGLASTPVSTKGEPVPTQPAPAPQGGSPKPDRPAPAPRRGPTKKPQGAAPDAA